jgi:hypothetical protein
MFLLACSNTNVSPDNSLSSNSTIVVNCASLKKEEWAKCEENKIKKLEQDEKKINLDERLDEFVKPIKK